MTEVSEIGDQKDSYFLCRIPKIEYEESSIEEELEEEQEVVEHPAKKEIMRKFNLERSQSDGTASWVTMGSEECTETDGTSGRKIECQAAFEDISDPEKRKKHKSPTKEEPKHMPDETDGKQASELRLSIEGSRGSDTGSSRQPSSSRLEYSSW